MRRLIGFVFLALLILSGCSSSAWSTQVWIDVPINNLLLHTPQTINIEGHASSPEGVALVEVWVNGVIVEGIDTTGSTESIIQFTSSFTPPDFGEYTIQVIATGNNGESSTPDTARVIIKLPTPVPEGPPPPDPDEHTPTPITDDGPTPIPLTPTPYINYWADPSEIAAGGCTTIYWDVLNVGSVVFGGHEREFRGSYSDCMCETQTYPLTITYPDGTSEIFYVTINVSGTCATPTPIPDTTAPAPPVQLKPLNGESFPACYGDTILRWEASSDPSGISQYRVQVERHPGDNNWQAAPGSVFTGITDTNLPLSIECGYTYRWRVRAIDGAGNPSNWSGWFTFIDPLI
jgi:hypothetical protein